jgi:PAS domain-containing protein
VQELIGQVTHIASIAIERAQDEAALKRSEAFLAQGQHLSSTGSFSWRVDTDDITFSEELNRIFEFDSDGRVRLEQISGRIHPEDTLFFSEQVEFARRTGGNLDYEIRLRLPDDSVKYLRTISHTSRDENG